MKKLYIVIAAIILALALVGCNRQMVDFTFKYDKAVVSLPDGTIIKGDVSSWRDYEDGDQIQVKIDGVTYLVHSSNIALIAG